MNLFAFSVDWKPENKFIIGAESASEAWKMLDRWILECPQLPGADSWNCEMLKKVREDVFSLA